MKSHFKIPHKLFTAVCSLALTTLAWSEPSQYLGEWALTVPGGAGFLGVTKEKGYYDGSILWVGGSVVPVASVFFNDDNLFVTRINEVRRRDASGKVVRTQQFVEVIIGELNGDDLKLTRIRPREDGEGLLTDEFSGKRQPPMPPAPDLAKVKFGDTITLFNGKDLEGWKLTDPKQLNGWSVADGILVNRPVQEPGTPHKSYGNLRTEREFEDFNLTLETRLAKGGNSGIYLRGIYEVQVADSYGRKLDPHNMGGIYSRVTPTVSAEKPAGEWQSFDITLVDRHVTVILNGAKIIDNAPVLGCTGGALWSDPTRPGPIYLQGDHSGIEYRNIRLRPVVK